ncbi:hypothetical protein B0T13DRAFT_452174 [Neurospora crassa]|nr:hypothetical protein B0T13DRAFT_452174 [Neurospora crassa]
MEKVDKGDLYIEYKDKETLLEREKVSIEYPNLIISKRIIISIYVRTLKFTYYIKNSVPANIITFLETGMAPASAPVFRRFEIKNKRLKEPENLIGLLLKDVYNPVENPNLNYILPVRIKSYKSSLKIYKRITFRLLIIIDSNKDKNNSEEDNKEEDNKREEDKEEDKEEEDKESSSEEDKEEDKESFLEEDKEEDKESFLEEDKEEDKESSSEENKEEENKKEKENKEDTAAALKLPAIILKPSTTAAFKLPAAIIFKPPTAAPKLLIIILKPSATAFKPSITTLKLSVTTPEPLNTPEFIIPTLLLKY